MEQTVIRPKTPQDILTMTEAVEILLNQKLITFSVASEIAKKIFDDEVETKSVYYPMFHIFCGTNHYKLYGWEGDGIDPKISTYGMDLVEFVKSQPEYGTSQYLRELCGWCICLQAVDFENEVLPGSTPMPAGARPQGGPPKAQPPKKDANAGKSGPPPKDDDFPTPPATSPPAMEDIPFAWILIFLVCSAMSMA